MADFAGSSVSVIGKAVNNNCYAVRTIALINAVFIVCLFAVACCLLYEAVDIIVRDIVGLSLLNKLSKLRVAGGISAAFLYCNYDFTAYLCENLGSCAVLLTLFSFNRTPFRMS